VNKNTLALIFLLVFIFQFTANAQEQHTVNEMVPFSPHRIAIMIGHTHIPKASTGTQESGIIVPSWGLSYSYWINYQWAVGIQSDMEIASYVVEEHDSKEIERERPIILALVGIFKPTHHIVLLGGFGREFEKHNDYWVTRLGFEYEFELQDGWDLSPGLVYDIKESAYDSWTIGLAVGKRL